MAALCLAALCGCAGTLVVLPVAELRIDRPPHLVRRKGRRDGPALRAYCEVLPEKTADR